VSCAKTVEPIEMPFGFGLGLAQGRMCYMECILAPPGKYDSAVRVRWRCGLFLKLLCPRVILTCTSGIIHSTVLLKLPVLYYCSYLHASWCCIQCLYVCTHVCCTSTAVIPGTQRTGRRTWGQEVTTLTAGRGAAACVPLSPSSITW